MRGYWLAKGVKVALVAALALGAFGAVVMGLWNSLLPPLFGVPALGFWQALGVLILSRILFGGFGGGPGRHTHGRRGLMERWERMTPEEREELRAGLRARCGDPAPSRSAPTV